MFAFETLARRRRRDQYVQTCDGDPDTATAGFFGVWRSQELSALVGWMCEWNSTHPNPKDRLSVFAFDVQWQAGEDAQALTDFLRRVGDDPEAAPYDGLSRCAVVEGTFRLSRQTPAENTAACDGAARAVAARFARDAKPLTRQVGKTDLAWAKLRLAGLQAWLEEMIYFNSDFPRAYEARDRGMATLFAGIRALRLPKTAKVAVWAHNGHVTRDPNAFSLTTMGSFLATSLRNKYVVLGLVSAEASVDWPGSAAGRCRRSCPAPAPSRRSSASSARARCWSTCASPAPPRRCSRPARSTSSTAPRWCRATASTAWSSWRSRRGCTRSPGRPAGSSRS